MINIVDFGFPGHIKNFPGGSDGKGSACSAGDSGLIPGQEGPLEKGMATTPVSLARESHGQRSLAGYSLSCRKESDTTERLTLTLMCI